MNEKVRMIRETFGKGDAIRDQNFTTPKNIVRRENISYGPEDKWNLLDVYYIKGTECPQKTIISIHGGAWVYGTKETYQYYCMDLARRGYTVINFNYHLAPEHHYPAALEDINRVFHWVEEHAKDYYVDIHKLFVVGDSAGAQLCSQYMALLTNQEYQKYFDFQVPDLKVKAIALNCGLYDLEKVCASQQDEMLMIYFEELPKKEELDVMHYVNQNFPPSFIMTSYYDFLKAQAKPMYEYLQQLGVASVYKMYGSEDRKDIAHVFHLNLSLEEAKQCNDEECQFFEQYLN